MKKHPPTRLSIARRHPRFFQRIFGGYRSPWVKTAPSARPA